MMSPQGLWFSQFGLRRKPWTKTCPLFVLLPLLFTCCLFEMVSASCQDGLISVQFIWLCYDWVQHKQCWLQLTWRPQVSLKAAWWSKRSGKEHWWDWCVHCEAHLRNHEPRCDLGTFLHILMSRDTSLHNKRTLRLILSNVRATL